MPRVKVSRTIHASPNTVWEIISDYKNISKFHPFLTHITPTGEIENGPGAIRQCHLKDGKTQTEEVIAWEEGRSITQRSVDAPLMRHITGQMIIDRLDEALCRVTIDTRFVMKYGPLGWILGTLVMAPALHHVLGQVLKGLQRYVETGEEIGPSAASLTS